MIQRDNQEVARLITIEPINWRDNMKTKLQMLVSAEELIKPLEDVWEEYV
ncbi:MAG: hypothetical protein KJ063_15075 [Anaerolineae bacterium]|nr:hypothetical protein [Anaerolineae bacterium]